MTDLLIKMAAHVEDNIFLGREMCVVGTVGLTYPQKEVDFAKTEIENLIIAHGGQVTQHPRKHYTFCVICLCGVNITTRAFAKNYKLVLTPWIIKCIESKSLLEFQEEDLFDLTLFDRAPRGILHSKTTVSKGVVYESDDE